MNFKIRSGPPFARPSVTVSGPSSAPLASWSLQEEVHLGMPDQLHWLAAYISPSKSIPSSQQQTRQTSSRSEEPISEIVVNPQDSNPANREQAPRVKLPIIRKKIIINKDSSVSKETNQTHHTHVHTYTCISNMQKHV